eukprot:TRINITY_DN21891_c0_g1_i1.p1 TRINITY_DN21891_c0_g1~~TRINITY_DN21891_c0_g1_i1.p1  ORF type:complete len:976 (+),score=145.62 TRINITY_DN21891_c0_g1_i1:70-2997(+)
MPLQIQTILELLAGYCQYTALLSNLDIDWPDLSFLKFWQVFNLSFVFWRWADSGVDFRLYFIVTASAFPLGCAVIFLFLFKNVQAIAWYLSALAAAELLILGVQLVAAHAPDVNWPAIGCILGGVALALVNAVVYYFQTKKERLLLSSFRNKRASKLGKESNRLAIHPIEGTGSTNPLKPMVPILPEATPVRTQNAAGKVRTPPAGRLGFSKNPTPTPTRQVSVMRSPQPPQSPGKDKPASGEGSIELPSAKPAASTYRPKTSRGNQNKISKSGRIAAVWGTSQQQRRLSVLLSEMTPEEYQEYAVKLTAKTNPFATLYYLFLCLLCMAAGVAFTFGNVSKKVKYLQAPLFVGIAFLALGVVFIFVTILTLRHKGRQLLFQIQAVVKNLFLQIVLVVLNVCFIPVVFALFSVFNCAKKSCPEGYAWNDNMVLTPKTGVSKEMCLACTFDSGCSATLVSNICPASTSWRVYSALTVPCKKIMHDLWPAAIIIFIGFAIGVPRLFYTIVKVSDEAMQAMPTVPDPQRLKLPASRLWAHRVHMSTCAVKELYDPFHHRWRFFKLEWLGMKFLVVMIAYLSWRMPRSLPVALMLAVHITHAGIVSRLHPYINFRDHIVAETLSFCNILNLSFAMYAVHRTVSATAVLIVAIVNGILIAAALAAAYKFRKKGTLEIESEIESYVEAQRESVGLGKDELIFRFHKVSKGVISLFQRAVHKKVQSGGEGKGPMKLKILMDKHRDEIREMAKKLTPIGPDTIDCSIKQKPEITPAMRLLVKGITWHDIPKHHLTAVQRAYLEKESQIELQREICDRKLDELTLTVMTKHFLIIGILTFVGMAIGLNSIVRSNLNKVVVSSELQLQSTLEWQESLKKVTDWDNFTQTCCCRRYNSWSTQGKTLDLYLAEQYSDGTLPVEAWHCSGRTEAFARVRAMALGSADVFGYQVRPFCSRQFSPGCSLNVSDTSKVACNSSLPEYALELW